MAKLRAFTLMELLVVLAIVSIVAGMLFPVFSQARASALKTSCLGHFRQVGIALHMYSDDYDQLFVPINHEPASPPNSHNDRTWVQLLLPYAKSFAIFECPSDTTDRPRPEATFDQDLIPGDLYSEYYTASQRSNVGYNFQYLAPVLKINGVWTAEPKITDSIQEPSRMLMFLDSVWALKNGAPTGGGSWLVSPPCRYQEVDGQQWDTFAARASTGSTGGGKGADADVFAPVVGWEPKGEDVPNVYGGAWPWHLGRVNVCSVDTHVRAITLAQLSSGCDVLPKWAGDIYDRTIYPWSPQ